MVSDMGKLYPNSLVLSLNPCCSGIWSLTWSCLKSTIMANSSLNPCCSGIWSLTRFQRLPSPLQVGLNPCCSGIWSLTMLNGWNGPVNNSLNPCCSGIWSLTKFRVYKHIATGVLILVVVEYGLWPLKMKCTVFQALTLLEKLLCLQN